MSGTTLVLGIVALSTVALAFLVLLAKIVSNTILQARSQSRVGRQDLAEISSEVGRLRQEVSAEVERLRQRVASLETIVTDQGYDLDRRLGALLDDSDGQTDPGKPADVTGSAER